MARRDQFIKSKANYTLRKQHMVTSEGVIYEHDHVTIFPDDGMYDDVPLFSDSNFKFRVSTGYNDKKKQFIGSWTKNDDGDEVWTLDNCSGSSVSNETKIRLKPNYKSLKDFAYYGSVEELIKATVRDVALRFPGGICYLGEEAVKITIGNTNYYTVANDFQIDVWSENIDFSTVDNPLRYLSASLDKYVDGNGNDITYISVSKTDSTCLNTIVAEVVIGETKLYVYAADTGDTILLTKNGDTRFGEVIVKPRHSVFEEEYEKLDDFEKVLLNLKTKPIFKATLTTPYFDGQHYYETDNDYIWPSIGEGNFYMPRIEGMSLEAYIGNLVESSKYYDEYETDNIWRMLTHESIKNLDWTFVKKEDGEDDDFAMDSSRIRGILQLYGRQFDDLKRYADNIKRSTAITYDENGNAPDYFLTDSVEYDGWEAYHVSPSKDANLITEALYPGSTYSGYTNAEANINFMRRLSINSDYIQSMKGTRRGLKTILGLFGMEYGKDYTIDESIYVAQKAINPSEFICILPYKNDYSYNDDITEGYPLMEVIPPSGDSYMVPWPSRGEDMYFQMKGGWEKRASKKIDLGPMTDVTEISGIEIYGESEQYMKYVASLPEMTELTNTEIFEGMICYVDDITGIYDSYKDENGDIPRNFSHYFILMNVALSTNLGFVKNDLYNCYGWRNILDSELQSDGLTEDGKRVLYLESLVTVFKGNNPHTGRGTYDDGREYLERLNMIFKHDIERNNFSSIIEGRIDGGITLSDIEKVGFDIPDDAVTDNEKCYYFVDSEDVDDSHISLISGDSDGDWDDMFNDPKYDKFVNYEDSSKSYDEAASLSIINVKNVAITFIANGNEYLKDYINNIVVKYVEQMIPSTAILEIKFDDDKVLSTPEIPVERMGGSFTKIINADAVYGDTDFTGTFDTANNVIDGNIKEIE